MTTANDDTDQRLMAGVTGRTRPGLPEVLAGAVVYGLSFGGVVLLFGVLDDPVVTGVVGLAASGVMGILAFGAAYLVRIRRLDVLGVRRVRWTAVASGVGLGVAAWALGMVASTAYIMLTGDQQNVQTDYQAAAAGGMFALVLTIAMGSLLTPLGEELFFRGVVANALDRFGAWISIPLSAAIFALAHGINPVMPTAFMVGLCAAVLLRRTRSIWPGVAVHATNNLLAIFTPLVLVPLIVG